MRPPALETPEVVASLQDFAGSVPATRGSLPPLDPASLIPVSLEREKESQIVAGGLTGLATTVKSCQMTQNA